MDDAPSFSFITPTNKLTTYTKTHIYIGTVFIEPRESRVMNFLLRSCFLSHIGVNEFDEKYHNNPVTTTHVMRLVPFKARFVGAFLGVVNRWISYIVYICTMTSRATKYQLSADAGAIALIVHI